MAEIRYGTRWRVKSDEHCWRVQVIDGTEPDGSPHWQSLTFHRELSQALLGLRLRLLRDSGIVGMDAIVAENARIAAELEDAAAKAQAVDT